MFSHSNTSAGFFDILFHQECLTFEKWSHLGQHDVWGGVDLWLPEQVEPGSAHRQKRDDSLGGGVTRRGPTSPKDFRPQHKPW